MGCCYSKIGREEAVARCKSRRRYMKQLVAARHAFSASHTTYLRSLRTTGAALLQFSADETHLHHHHYNQHHLPPSHPPTPPLPPPPPPPPPKTPSLPLNPLSDNWTSVTASPALPPPPPPPSSWDFWYPFAASSSRSVAEEEWEVNTSVTASETTAAVTVSTDIAKAVAPATQPSVVSGYSKENESELAVVVSRNSKDLGEIMKELDEYFLKAANAGSHVSLLLEAPSSSLSNHRTTSK